ncbi:patatin-like phospholipase family protein [Corallococcus interemptor]|uniref:Patatin-like phospholipase family protein n=1 Tax=Corallococcus interemptor TaxID=2316720 RepID=A0A3A8QE73_9BACT|nr:patatin-like phospholipase family protein [Corallococcus interemptor]RKH49223.1 patatin-like phospholipase family protein [Corallococcus sp. AB050B]RKH66993.1 patatin-like phospholipase family protein [Corallococcus interemptor]
MISSAKSCVACVLLLLTSTASAQALPSLQSPAPKAVSLTVSGGVSLGTYEAGFLYYSGTSSQGERAVDLRLVTGASAGSLNALLAIMATCGVDASTPGQSLFWDIWVPIGFNDLFVPTSTTALGVFSREALERRASHIEQAWNQGLDRACDVVIGVSTTRLSPRALQAANGRLDLPRLEEKFAIRIQGRGKDRPPRATNYTTREGRRLELLLETDEHGEIPFANLRELLLASMSFPIAFPPQPLRTCAPKASAKPGECQPSEAKRDLFIDGGVFDNTPLRLAVGLARDGLRETADGKLEWRPIPQPDTRTTPPGIAFAFIDPDATEYPVAPPAQADASPTSLPATLAGLLATFVDTARSKELAMLLEEEPEIAKRLTLPRRHFPAAGAPLFAFLGFFERSFRVFDFYLGMYDARRMMDDAFREGRTPSEEPRAAAMDGIGGWQPFACMSAVYDALPSAEQVCQGEALADFRALLQMSLDQLYDACSRPEVTAPAGAWRNTHCDRALAGQPPPRVPGLQPGEWPEWKQRKDESELSYSMRLLGAYGFGFQDLGVPKGRGDLAVLRIRHALGDAAHRLAAAQPAADKPTVRFASKLAVDSISYEPQRLSLHITMGPTTSEVGLSVGASAMPLSSGLRFAGALGFRGLADVFSSGSSGDPFGVALTGGLEFQPRSEQTFLSQSRLALRAGWLFSAKDQYGTISCPTSGASHVTACSRPVVQGLVGITFLEFLRAQLVGEWYPSTEGRKTLWSMAPGIGLELGL